MNSDQIQAGTDKYKLSQKDLATLIEILRSFYRSRQLFFNDSISKISTNLLFKLFLYGTVLLTVSKMLRLGFSTGLNLGLFQALMPLLMTCFFFVLVLIFGQRNKNLASTFKLSLLVYFLCYPALLLQSFIDFTFLSLLVTAFVIYYWFSAFRHYFGRSRSIVKSFVAVVFGGFALVGVFIIYQTNKFNRNFLDSMGGDEVVKEMAKENDPPQVGDSYHYRVVLDEEGSQLEASLKVKVLEINEPKQMKIKFDISFDRGMVSVVMPNEDTDGLSFLAISNIEAAPWESTIQEETMRTQGIVRAQNILRNFYGSQSKMMTANLEFTHMIGTTISSLGGDKTKEVYDEKLKSSLVEVAGIKGIQRLVKNDDGTVSSMTVNQRIFLPTLEVSEENSSSLKLIKFERD